VLAYNWALNREEPAMAEVRAFANDLHAVLASAPSPQIPRTVSSRFAETPCRMACSRTAHCWCINTTPLVEREVLVLLIIFLITIPVVTSAVKLALPQDRTCAQPAPDRAALRISVTG
jgi:hypothetical protein